QCGAFYREAVKRLNQHVAMLSGEEAGVLPQNPNELHAMLRILVEIYSSQRRLARRDNPRLAEAMLNLSLALQHVQHRDRGLALFNGGIQGDPGEVSRTRAVSKEILAQLPETMAKSARQSTPS